MSNLQVTLPDGSVKSVPAGSAPIDVARSISPRLADDALVAKVNGESVGSEPSAWKPTPRSQILTPKNPEALEVYRHSTAHLLAAAVLELYPETKLGIGPPIENGFYYDFQRPDAFSPDDLEKIEKKMWEIQAQDLPYERQYMEKEEGLKLYGDQPMKCELITEKADAVFSEYTLGPHFIDFCRGPHVPSTKNIKAFKLLSIAGAYWKGNEKNAQLQRIYGTAFFTKKELDEYLAKLEEAKKRDHRKLGQELDLFSIQELAGPGLIFFHPKGAHRSQDHRRLDARPIPAARLRPGLHAARHARGSVEDLRPPEPLRRKHVRRHGTRRRRISAETHELPGPHPDLSRQACAAIANCRCGWANWERLPLRAQRDHARPAARARLHAGRRAHFLHAGTDRRRSRELPGIRPRYAEDLWV